MIRDTTPTHIYKQPLIGWIVDAAWLECQACRDEDETAPQHLPPTTASPCSWGGLVLMAPSHLHNDDPVPSTYSHAYKPLLIGWIVGTDGRGREEGNGDNNRDDGTMGMMR